MQSTVERPCFSYLNFTHEALRELPCPCISVVHIGASNVSSERSHSAAACLESGPSTSLKPRLGIDFFRVTKIEAAESVPTVLP